jgi:hypothetical protein
VRTARLYWRRVNEACTTGRYNSAGQGARNTSIETRDPIMGTRNESDDGNDRGDGKGAELSRTLGENKLPMHDVD